MTTRQVRFLRRSVAHLQEISAYLDHEAPDVRERIIEGILRIGHSLASHAAKGLIARDPALASRGFRTMRCERYVLFYKIVGRVVRVHRVLHERRSWTTLL